MWRSRTLVCLLAQKPRAYHESVNVLFTSRIATGETSPRTSHIAAPYDGGIELSLASQMAALAPHETELAPDTPHRSFKSEEHP